MYSSSCRVTAEKPNGSKAVTLLLRLSTLALSLTSAVVMATATECTIDGRGGGGAKVTVTFKNYRPFVYQVVLNITAAVLEASTIYLQVGKSDGDGGEEEAPKLPRIILVVLDVVVPALVNLATGAVIAAVIAYGPEINACTASGARFCEQVHRSKLVSIAASITASSAAVAKDISLPFSVWPISSESDGCSY